jgi:hypothetical protein
MRNKCGIYRLAYLLNIFTYLFIILVIILCTVVMIISMLAADFCIDPTANSLRSLPKTSSIYTTLNFYLNCDGTSVFEDDMTSLANELNSINSYIDSLPLTTSCLNTLKSQYQAMNDNFSNLNEQILSCHPLNALFHGVVEDAFCSDFFDGTAKTFALIYITALCFFFLIYFNNRFFVYVLDFEDSIFFVKDKDKEVSTLKFFIYC